MQSKGFLSLNYFLLNLVCFSFFMSQSRLESSESLQTMYQFYCESPSNIHEHLPILQEMAKECASVAEIGSDFVATWGILQGLSENPSPFRHHLVIDLDYPAADKLDLAKQLASEEGIDFIFWQVNDMHIDLEPTDLLLIDPRGRHTYCHLTYELEAFSPRICKYICLHNTSEPWGKRDDEEYRGSYAEYPGCDKQKRGLWQAVVDFLEKHPEWILQERRTNNYGLTILKRKDENEVAPRVYDPQVEYYLKNKIILCTGPSLWRYNQLKRITEADLELIPFKKIFLSTNDPANMEITFNGRKPVCEFIGGGDKTIDCLNCIITTMRNAVNDPEVEDDDIILFKHESVFINDMGLVRRVIGKLLQGADMIGRHTYWGLGTGEFWIKVSAIKDIIKDYPTLKALPYDDYSRRHGVHNAETYFAAYIINQVKNPYIIPLNHSHWKFTELGLYHIYSFAEYFAPTDISNLPWWDKKNYDQLYR